MRRSRTFHSSCGLLRKLDTHAYPPLKQPTNKRGRWEPIKTLKDIREEIGYTTEDIPLPKSGGRGPNGKSKIYCYIRICCIRAIKIDLN